MANSKLCQIIAVENGQKTRTADRKTKAYHLLQKGSLLDGLSKTYSPYQEGGEAFPSETTLVQVRVDEVVKDIREALLELFDITATKDWANCEARADIVVGGQVLVSQAPITYILFLEKQLEDIRTFCLKLPTLDPTEEWHWDENQNCFATKMQSRVKTKKMPRVLRKAEATKEHPEQVEVWHEDVGVGTWNEIKYSGAITAQRVKELVDRVEKLQRAVKFAREEANQIEVSVQKVGDPILNYLLG